MSWNKTAQIIPNEAYNGMLLPDFGDTWCAYILSDSRKIFMTKISKR